MDNIKHIRQYLLGVNRGKGHIRSLLVKNKSGSGAYRRILSRGDKKSDINNPTTWRKKLDDITITSSFVKRMKLNLLSKALPSEANDVLTRIKLGRTLYGNSGVHAGILDDPWCTNCVREDNKETEDSLFHSLYNCPHVFKIIQALTKYS